MAHRDLERLPDGNYDVVIDSTLSPGSLSYGELFLPGESTDEVLLLLLTPATPRSPTTTCPGLALVALLARDAFARVRRRYSYRFLFAPGTIGSIAWLSRNEAATQRIRHGLVVACVGDAGALTYKRSRRGDAEIDRAAGHVLRAAGTAAHDPRLLALRLRRTPVLLAGLRSSGRQPDAHAARALSRVPHVGRRPRLRPAGEPRRLARRLSHRRRDPRGQRPLSQHASEGRAAARPPRPLPRDGRLSRSRRGARWRCSGCSTSPTAARRSSTSPNARASPSTPSAPRPTPVEHELLVPCAPG